MILLEYIIWSPDPVIFKIPLSFLGLPDRPIVWYGLLFAMGFIIGQQISYRIFKAEGHSEKDVDTLTTFMVIATILGARLGHCLFYNPSYYLADPIEILKIWEGGLASHGGAIGIFLALWLYANYDIRSKWAFVIPTSFSVKKRKKEGQSYFWVLDRVAIVVAITGALIRTGNFMNSEMEGVKTGTDYGVVYARATEGVLNFDEDAIEEVVFEEGTYDPTHPGYLPMKAVVKLKSGVKVDQAMKGFINGQLAYRLNNYQEVVEHVDFAASGRGLNYQIIDEAGAERIEINATGILRHTPQLYEAIACLIIAFILLALWNYKRAILNDGLIFSVFMVLLWGDRFFNEFFKMNQEAFEASLPINMGQILSIPLILIGVVVFLMTVRKKETV